ncbi:MAG TPA: hypothetical protein VF865_17895 [Acidobacteriaceae bacterium]
MKEMTQPWSRIAEHYARLVSKGAAWAASMLNLVRQIEQSRYATGLFGWTSMDGLYIVQTPVEYPYYGPRLQIALKPRGLVEFRYIDSYFEERQWSRTVNADEAFARLEGFLDALHWFVKYEPAAKTEREETR